MSTAEEKKHVSTSEERAALAKSPGPQKHTGDMRRAQREKN